ncbi:hypothetical protein GPA27_13815 [Aromatoleum toluolicum]|uniref:Transposase n=1 Tax=Aromatoleum toluolicum TaxID=90060 RepID=A0ABX1NGN5_9RHOO|nr:hypothetical protein [Aromatoleum toluolicum]NMF98462.1 hypothetical protein [Aromatoleum toluolicum]
MIYEFGVRIDENSRSAVEDQIIRARRLYNDLVAQIRAVVAEMNSYVLNNSGGRAQTLHAEVEALDNEFDSARARNDESAMKSIAETRWSRSRELHSALTETRKHLKGELQSRFLARIGKNSACDTYHVRSEAVASGLGWATANAVLESALQAFRKSIQQGRGPRFSIGADKVQDTLTLQFPSAGGVLAKALLEGKHRELALLPTNGCGRRKYGEFRFRLGAATANTYATGTWQYHRPLPEGAQIVVARLVRRKIGKDYKWAVQLMVRLPEPVFIVTEARKPLASVHFGWATDVEGRRVAAIADSADPHAARLVCLPRQVEETLKRVAALQSERDTSRDGIIPLVKAIEANEDWGDDVLVELAALRKLPVHHVAISRLHRLCRMLREAQALPEWLDVWRKEDRIRWQSVAHMARHARNTRRDYYRDLAADLVRRYDAIVLEPLELADTLRKIDENTGERGKFGRKARSGLMVAALYELESAIRWSATKARSAVLELIGKTANCCAVCGGQVRAADEDHQLLRCLDCGADLDRKKNGAAMAWQVCLAQREDAVRDFWIERRAAHEKQRATKAERLVRMTEGRRQARGGNAAKPR